MRTMFRIFAICCLIGLSVGVPTVSAQQGIVNGPRGGNSVRLLEGGRGLITPSRVWFEANLADDGFGYDGPYVTLGSKTHFADDFLDGRWLAEGQANLSLDSGGFFANFGVQRVFTLKNPGADIVVGGWIDYDGDDSGSFGHKFWQVSANAAIKTQRWDLIANGYLPFGTTDFTVGTPGAEPSFDQNRIVLQAGIDSALRGFDFTLRTRPQRLAHFNGHFDIGTYGFESDTVDFFFGSRLRLGAQFWRGWQSTVELNYDDRFEFTGALQMAYVWGTGHRGTAAGLGNDLDRTVRNDHIVRFRRDPVFAIDPDTGRAFNVVHVDNTAAAGGAGTFESRFDSLADAQAASGTDDIIFVHAGDGTDTNYNTGIVLKDRQLLLGDGVEHIIQDASGNFFRLPNNATGPRPIISATGGNAITIASNNTIRGFDIQGGLTTQFGIFGDGTGSPIENVLIEDVNIQNTVNDGIAISNTTGNVDIDRVTISQVAGRGIDLDNIGNANATINILNTTISQALLDGIRLNNYDATTINIASVNASTNQGDGIELIGHRNAAGTGAVFTFQEVTTNGNGNSGIRLEDAQGTQAFLGITSNANAGAGLELVDVRQVSAGQQTLIANFGNTVTQSTFVGNNGVGIFNNLTVAGATQTLNINASQVDTNTVGIQSMVSGVGTSLTTNILNNFSIQTNDGDGIVLRSVNGSTHEANIRNDNGTLNLQNNGAVNGNGISMFVDDGASANPATLTANIDNINLGTTGNSSGIFGNVGNQGTLIANINNVAVQNAGSVLNFNIATTNNNFISRIRAENIVAGNTTGSGAAVTVGANAALDFTLLNSTFTNTEQGQVFATGANITNAGRMRLDITNVTITQFDAQGILVNTVGNGQTLATLTGNTIFNNGPLFGVPNSDRDNSPHTHGVDFQVANNGRLDLTLTNNILRDNLQQGFNLVAANASTANIVMVNNLISGNDDGGPDPGGANPPDRNFDDLNVFSANTANVCLSMSQNTFALDAELNNGSANAFILELDGATNIGNINQGGVITPAVFGTTCAPAIQAQEAVFTGFGF